MLKSTIERGNLKDQSYHRDTFMMCVVPHFDKHSLVAKSKPMDNYATPQRGDTITTVMTCNKSHVEPHSAYLSGILMVEMYTKRHFQS